VKAKFIFAPIIAIVFISGAITAYTVFFTGAGAVNTSRLLSQGEKCLSEENFDEALELFLSVIENDPDNVNAYIGAADSYVGKGRLDRAIAILEKGYDITRSARILIKIDNVESLRPPEIGDIIYFGGYDWRVLDIQDGKALIITERVLVNTRGSFYTKFITWEDSDLREYLNGEFYDSFSEHDKAFIEETYVVNDDYNPDLFVFGGNDTYDYVFLLSVEEVRLYFADNESTIALNTGNRTASWYLRTPGYYTTNVARVRYDGVIDMQSGYGSSTYVRPAMWIYI